MAECRLTDERPPAFLFTGRASSCCVSGFRGAGQSGGQQKFKHLHIRDRDRLSV